MKIKKNDNVILLAGKDKGKKGKVLRAIPAENKVIVEGLNLVKRHMKPRKEGKKGEILEIAAPIHVSNVALSDKIKSKKSANSAKIEKTAKVEKTEKSKKTAKPAKSDK
ncbi:MAG TPA: 50S ribosomal protein L24 [Candidatus Paceibacterota bacterium]|nr:50S ribosomal protein L24 [Candidatus Paceibacterota bacterium]